MTAAKSATAAPAPFDPPASRCACWYYEDDPRIHDRLLQLDDLDPITAVRIVCELVSDDTTAGDEFGPWPEEPPVPIIAAPKRFIDTRPFFSSPEDVRRFFGMHNWRDPHAVYEMAMSLEFLAYQANSGRWSGPGPFHLPVFRSGNSEAAWIRHAGQVMSDRLVEMRGDKPDGPGWAS